jgi:hypothetical protein
MVKRRRASSSRSSSVKLQCTISSLLSSFAVALRVGLVCTSALSLPILLFLLRKSYLFSLRDFQNLQQEDGLI